MVQWCNVVIVCYLVGVALVDQVVLLYCFVLCRCCVVVVYYLVRIALVDQVLLPLRGVEHLTSILSQLVTRTSE